MSYTLDDNEERKPRIITTEAGSRILAKREDPYGLWVIYFERGQNPKDFDGTFTSFEQAVQCVNRYLSKQGKTKIAHVEMHSKSKAELNDLPKQPIAA